MRPVRVRLDEIRFEESVFPRRQVDWQRVKEFSELYGAEGLDALPPVELVPLPEGGYLVADGVHRLYALGGLDAERAPATVLALGEGDDPYAFAYRRALACATRSAKPLSRAERHAAIRRLAAEQPDASDREIGRLVGVDHKTVGRVRRGEPRASGGHEPRASHSSRSRSLTPFQAAVRLFKGFEQAYRTRGLGITDYFIGDRTGERLAHILVTAHEEHALERARQFRDWLDQAINTLEQKDSEAA